MKIVDYRKNRLESFINNIYNGYKYILLFVFIFTVFFTGVISQKHQFIGNEVTPIIRELYRKFYYFKNPTINPSTIYINISHLNFQKIAFTRMNAIKNNYHVTSNEKFVSASINYNNVKSNIDIKLKGAGSDHWKHPNKWSFKVKVKNNHYINGMRKFDLMNPSTRGYNKEWIFHKLLKYEGLIYKRIMYVNLNVNGKDLGLYVLVEDLDKNLIENNQRRNGPIVGYDKSIHILESIRLNKIDHGLGDSNFYSKSVITYNNQSTLPEEKEVSLSILENVRKGSIGLDEGFDIENMGRFLAIKALMVSMEFDPNDTPFYYNTVTTKLEPVGQEIHSLNDRVGNWWINNANNRNSQFHKIFFSNNKLLKSYYESLTRICTKNYLDQFFKLIDDELNYVNLIILSEYETFETEKSRYYDNVKYINVLTNPIKEIHSYKIDYNNSKYNVSVGNLQFWPIELMGIEFKNNQIIKFPDEDIIISSRSEGSNVNYDNYYITLNDRFINSIVSTDNPHIVYKIIGSKKIKKQKIINYNYNSNKLITSLKNNVRGNISDHYFIKTLSDRIHIPKGNWQLLNDLVIPKGTQFHIDAGAVIDLINYSSIVSFSPIYLNGNQNEFIKIFSSDSSGMGMSVLNADDRSIITSTIFDNLSNLKNNVWNMTGSINFYNSNVILDHVTFSNNNSEDNLNIIRSEYEINNCHFNNSGFDAFDSDFSNNGSISNTTFNNSGNDAIDISGGNVVLKNLEIRNSKDKAISVGENSITYCESISIFDALIGIVSKDNSYVNCNNININSTKIGISAYMKKREYGGGKIIIKDASMYNVDDFYISDSISTITVLE